MGKQWKLTNFIFCGSKITADGDCSHEIKRRLLPGRKAMTNLDSILKSRLLLLSRFSRVQLCVTPETAAHQAPPSLGFSRQEHWSGLPFPSPMRESEVAQVVYLKVTQSCPTPSDPIDCSLQAPLSMGFSRQEYWSGVPLPSPKGGIDDLICKRDL